MRAAAKVIHSHCVLEHFRTPYMKITYMKNSLKFLKTVWCNKIKKTNFVNAINHHHVLQCFSPLMLTAILGGAVG